MSERSGTTQPAARSTCICCSALAVGKTSSATVLASCCAAAESIADQSARREKFALWRPTTRMRRSWPLAPAHVLRVNARRVVRAPNLLVRQSSQAAQRLGDVRRCQQHGLRGLVESANKKRNHDCVNRRRTLSPAPLLVSARHVLEPRHAQIGRVGKRARHAELQLDELRADARRHQHKKKKRRSVGALDRSRRGRRASTSCSR